MNTDQLTPRALDVIAASDEYTAPIFRERPGAVDACIFIDFKQATDLLAMFGGEPNEITLQIGDGHSGRGLYASYTDMPEEGTIFLGISDQEAEPDVVPPKCSTCDDYGLIGGFVSDGAGGGGYDSEPCPDCAAIAATAATGEAL